jgi:hypothetical protein
VAFCDVFHTTFGTLVLTALTILVDDFLRAVNERIVELAVAVSVEGEEHQSAEVFREGEEGLEGSN